MSKPIIICIDDEPMVLESLKVELKEVVGNEYFIETAEGGEEALELIEDLQADDEEVSLVISDYLMPGMKGDEVLKQIHARSPNTLKVMLTGQADLEAVGNAIKHANLYRYIAKPWQPEDLKLTVVEAVRSFLHEKKLDEQNVKLRQMYAELEQLNASLEQKVAERTAALEQKIIEQRQAEAALKAEKEKVEAANNELETALTNLKTAQSQLVLAEKMAALGQLITGIAHEINTPLGAIKASIGNLSGSLDRALEVLPEFSSAIYTDNGRLKLFTMILENFSAAPDLSAKEQRQFKRQLRATLNAEGIEDAVSLADTLMFMKIYNNLDELLPLLKDPEALFIVEAARDFISLQKNSANIALAVDKAAKIVFALRKFSHQEQPGIETETDIIDGIETVLTLYHNQIKQGIKVIKTYRPLPLVWCDADEIQQVWTNIIHNALQAMGLNGTLTIETTDLNEQIRVSFSDTGGGISAEVKQRIFEPFFTTKKRGEGSGLGLHIVKNIVDKHQGKTEIESEVGKGTTFTVYLPVNATEGA